MGNFDLKCDKSKAKAMKSLLRLFRRVLHNVNNRIFYLDEMTYVTSRKHLTDLVGSFVEFETTVNTNTFYDEVYRSHKSLTLLELLDKTMVMVRDYPDNGRTYYEILSRYYFDNFKYTHDEIIEVLEMSSSNYYRYFNQAIACFYMHLIPVLKANEYDFEEDVLQNGCC